MPKYCLYDKHQKPLQLYDTREDAEEAADYWADEVDVRVAEVSDKEAEYLENIV